MSRLAGFEGSYLGDAGRLDPDSILECKICWYRYDPAQGDPVWQIAPGTPFAELPDYWRCPECDGEAAQFMVVAREADGNTGPGQ